MFQELQKGWIPPDFISEEEYIKVRDNKCDYPDYYVGYVGFNATFGAKYFGGYARGFKADKITPRNNSNEAYRNLMKQLPGLIGIKFTNGDYKENEYSDIKNAVIYCDPPYRDTTKYVTQGFNYEGFYDWCREKAKDNIVFISEYNMPDDFECIWEKEHRTSLSSHRGDKSKRIEKLFRLKQMR